MKDDIDRSVKKARKAAVGELQEEIQTRNNAHLVGCTLDVLVEGRKRGRLHGRSRGDKLVYLNTPSDLKSQQPRVGQTVEVEIIESSPWSLEAKLSGAQVKKEKVPVA